MYSFFPHDISKMRKYITYTVFNQSVKERTENTIPGELLFGPEFGERVKNFKSLDKAGQE